MDSAQSVKRQPNAAALAWIALLLAILTPFGLHFSLQAGQVVLAAVFFVLLAASMALTAWKC